MRNLLLTLFISALFATLSPAIAFGAAASIQETRVAIYPNPAKDVVYVKGQGVYRVELMNLIGEIMVSEQITTGAVSISDLRPGIYIVRTYDADGTLIASSKITKQ